MIEICFICTGGTCRSFMAERIAKKIAKDKNIKAISFSSAGVFSKEENYAENACLALKNLGYDGRGGKSELFKEKPNCLYVTMTNEHKCFINSKNVLSFEDLVCKVFDPYGKDLGVYTECAHKIEENVVLLLDKIQNLRGEV